MNDLYGAATPRTSAILAFTQVWAANHFFSGEDVGNDLFIFSVQLKSMVWRRKVGEAGFPQTAKRLWRNHQGVRKYLCAFFYLFS